MVKLVPGLIKLQETGRIQSGMTQVKWERYSFGVKRLCLMPTTCDDSLAP